MQFGDKQCKTICEVAFQYLLNWSCMDNTIQIIMIFSLCVKKWNGQINADLPDYSFD